MSLVAAATTSLAVLFIEWVILIVLVTSVPRVLAFPAVLGRCRGAIAVGNVRSGMETVTLRRAEVSAVGKRGAEHRAGSLELLLRTDATATTTMRSSPRRAASRGMQLSVTASIAGRKV